MTTQREAHGIQFSICPECRGHFGTTGLARHRKTQHGVAPAVAGARKVTLDRAALAILREAAAGQISEARKVYATSIKKLIKAGYLTEALEITAAGRGRV